MPVESPAVMFAPTPTMPLPNSILETVQRRLRESSYYYLRTVSCVYEQGVLTLRGKVPTFYLKQTLQSIVEKVDGVTQIQNLVDVTYPAGVR